MRSEVCGRSAYKKSQVTDSRRVKCDVECRLNKVGTSDFEVCGL